MSCPMGKVIRVCILVGSSVSNLLKGYYFRDCVSRCATGAARVPFLGNPIFPVSGVPHQEPLMA